MAAVKMPTGSSFGAKIRRAARSAAVIHGIVGKAGAWFDYKESKIGQGREATKIYLKENDKILTEIEKAVRAKVADLEA